MTSQDERKGAQCAAGLGWYWRQQMLNNIFNLKLSIIVSGTFFNTSATPKYQ
jgi:hypothetical protein